MTAATLCRAPAGFTPYHFCNKSSKGFTLVELLVVTAIIVVILGLIFVSQSSFNKTLILSNTAYDIALAVRSAETYGLGGRAISATPMGYGVHLDKATPGSFIFFADAYPAPSTNSVCHPTGDASALDAQPGNCNYDSGAGQDSIVSTYALGNGITIQDFCAFSAGAWACANAQGAALTTLDIVFARPNATPFISKNGAYSALAPVTSACLTVASPQGGNRFVSVSASGEITATAASCP